MSDEPTTATPPPGPPPPGTVVPSPVPEPPRRRRSGTANAGIILILVGAVFLVARLLPGIGWWNAWPLIIVIAGFIQAVTPGKEGWSVARMFDGLTTVAFGCVFLAIVFGVVGWGVWGTIFSLWPVLIIAIGLDLLGKSLHTSWFKVIGSIVVIAALAYAVSVNIAGDGGVEWYLGGELQSAEISEPVGDIEEATLFLEAGVSEVTLDGGRKLVEASGESLFAEPDFSVESEGTHADVRLSLGRGGSTVIFPGGPNARLSASLAKSVLWNIEAETGVSSLEADLRDVPVRTFVLKPGIADCEITLGDAPEDEVGTVDISAGISSVVLNLPEDAEIRVEAETGLTGLHIAGGIEKVGSGEWETEGFERARKQGDPIWIVHLKSGIGSLTVDTY